MWVLGLVAVIGAVDADAGDMAAGLSAVSDAARRGAEAARDQDGTSWEVTPEVRAGSERTLETVAWLGGGSDLGSGIPSVVGRGGVQLNFARRLGVEAGVAGLHRTRSLNALHRGIEPWPRFVEGDVVQPTWTADVRLQFRVVDASMGTRRSRELPMHLTLDLGVGAIGTTDDLDMLQCPGRQGDPCTETAVQTHPTPVLGSSFVVVPHERVRVRAIVQWRTWVDTVDGSTTWREGSTTWGLDLGIQLGRSAAKRASNKFERPLEPVDPVYGEGL